MLFSYIFAVLWSARGLCSRGMGGLHVDGCNDFGAVGGALSEHREERLLVGLCPWMKTLCFIQLCVVKYMT